MKKKDREIMEKKVSRKDFLKLGFGFLLGGIATGLIGCKQGTAIKKTTNAPLAQYGNFYGDAKTKVYHKPTCKLAPKPAEAVMFDSPTGAEYHGYRACYICKPDKI